MPTPGRIPYLPLALETEFSATGRFCSVKNSDSSLRTIRARFQTGEVRRAHALCLTGEGDALESLKVLIGRGHHDESQSLLSNLQKECSGRPDLLQEIALQRCRVAGMAGDWQEVVKQCTQLENESELPVLIRFSLLQMRANALLELREYSRSELDLKKADAIGQLFNYAPVHLFSQVLSAKVLARVGDPLSAELQSRSLWKSWKSTIPDANLDHLLTLLRLKLDLARINGHDHSKTAIACYRLATFLGDDLYAALAWLDWVFSIGAQDSAEAQARLDHYSFVHPRLKRLRDEWTRNDPSSDTAFWMRRWISRHGIYEKAEMDSSRLEKVDKIFILEHEVMIELTQSVVRKIPRLTPRSRQILQAVSECPVSKDELFLKVWGISRFVKERHDPTIRTAIRRLRQETGLELESVGGVVRLDEKVLVI